MAAAEIVPDTRPDFIAEYTQKSLRLKPERWVKFLQSEENKKILQVSAFSFCCRAFIEYCLRKFRISPRPLKKKKKKRSYYARIVSDHALSRAL
jgi:hypothetical protein